jgi:hypothetical protein
MSLDVYLNESRPTEIFTANCTHNLVEMANAAGIYQICAENLGLQAGDE